MKYSILFLALFVSINYSYSQNKNKSKEKGSKSVVKISSFTVGNITHAKLLRNKYKIEKVLKKRGVYAKRVAKAHKTCVNTRPKKDPVISTR